MITMAWFVKWDNLTKGSSSAFSFIRTHSPLERIHRGGPPCLTCSINRVCTIGW